MGGASACEHWRLDHLECSGAGGTPGAILSLPIHWHSVKRTPEGGRRRHGLRRTRSAPQPRSILAPALTIVCSQFLPVDGAILAGDGDARLGARRPHDPGRTAAVSARPHPPAGVDARGSLPRRRRQRVLTVTGRTDGGCPRTVRPVPGPGTQRELRPGRGPRGRVGGDVEAPTAGAAAGGVVTRSRDGHKNRRSRCHRT
jgi:hypothetical protein